MSFEFTDVFEFELSPGSLTTITDVLVDGVNARRGIDGFGPNDRCARTGTFTFTLRTDVGNSGGKQGYYSPGHPNCRAGFGLNTKVVWRTSPGGAIPAFTFFTGTVSRITPLPGVVREETVVVEAVDWIDQAARSTTNVGLQLNKRSDEIIDAILDGCVVSPLSRSLDVGRSSFPYAMHNVRDEHTKALTAISDTTKSESGWFYLLGNGTARFESRGLRVNTSPAFVLNDSFHDVDVGYDRSTIYNGITAVVHPTTVAASATTVLASITEPVLLEVGTSIENFDPFVDASNANRRCGGTDMVDPPVAGTDYKFNSQKDGLGTNLISSLSVTAVFSANGVTWSMANTGLVKGYVTVRQCRGRGLYDYAPVSVIVSDAASVATYGECPITIDMPSQSNEDTVRDFAYYILIMYAYPTSRPFSVSFLAVDELVDHALTAEIGTRFSLIETVSGISADFFIQSVEYAYDRGRLRATYGLTSADTDRFFVLGVSGIGEDSVLGY